MPVSTTKFGHSMKMTVSWLTLTFSHDRFILELKRSRASHHIARRAEREPPHGPGHSFALRTHYPLLHRLWATQPIARTFLCCLRTRACPVVDRNSLRRATDHK